MIRNLDQKIMKESKKRKMMMIQPKKKYCLRNIYRGLYNYLKIWMMKKKDVNK